jgi:hypothetical protein
LPELAGPANPESVSDVAPMKFVVRGTPFNCATDAAVNPVPVTVVEKTPKGSGDVPREVIAGGTLLTSVIVAALIPAEFEAVRVSVPDAGIDVGAV